MSYPNNYPVAKTTSILAILSTISGAASFFVIPLCGAIAALITGYMAKSEIKVLLPRASSWVGSTLG
jgi:hypothetical protein